MKTLKLTNPVTGPVRLPYTTGPQAPAEAMAQVRPEGEKATTGVLGGIEAYTSPSQRAWYEQELERALLAAQAPATPATPEALAALPLPSRRALAAQYGVLTPTGRPSSSVTLIWEAVCAAAWELPATAPTLRELEGMTPAERRGMAHCYGVRDAVTGRYSSSVDLIWAAVQAAPAQSPAPVVEVEVLAQPVRYAQPEQRHLAGIGVEKVAPVCVDCERPIPSGDVMRWNGEPYHYNCYMDVIAEAQGEPQDDEDGPHEQEQQQQAQVAPVWEVPGVLALPPVMTRESNCAQWRQHMTWAGVAQERIRAAATPEAIEAARLDAQAEARECVRLTDRLVEMRGEVSW